MTYDRLYGYEVIVSEHAMTQVWVYPKERFVEYVPSPETERWCRYFGYGHEEKKPACFIMEGKLYIHPELWTQLERHFASYEAREHGKWDAMFSKAYSLETPEEAKLTEVVLKDIRATINEYRKSEYARRSLFEIPMTNEFTFDVNYNFFREDLFNSLYVPLNFYHSDSVT